MNTELTDITFKSKQGVISLASLNLHVEQQGLNSIFMLPHYTNVNIVDWVEYDGADVDFSTATVDALPLELKIFGDIADIDMLVGKLRGLSNLDIEVAVKIKEWNFNNSINFTTKYVKSVKNKAVMVNDWELEHFLLTDEDSDYITTEMDDLLSAGVMMKKLKQIAFVTITLTRYNDDRYFGLLADNTRACELIPNVRFGNGKYPTTNVPIELRRYHVADRQATLVSNFRLRDELVYCYPIKGVVAGTTNYAESKAPFEVATEDMVGKVYENKMSKYRKSKTISVPLLIRSHSVSAIFAFLGKLKTYIHETLKSGDMLYLSGDQIGDMAVYPTGCNVNKAYIQDMPWVELTLQMCAYKEGFDYSAETDNVPEDNPDPPLPPAPAPTFDPYKDIDRSAWSVMSFSRSQDMYNMNYPLLVSPTAEDGLQYPFNSVGYVAPMIQGWSPYAESIRRYPVGTMFFAQDNTYTYKGKTRKICNTLICLPWCIDNLSSSLFAFFLIAMGQGWSKDNHTLVGVVQGCDVMSDTIENWSSKLQEEPNYGGIVGSGTVRVTKEALRQLNNMGVTIASGLTLTTSDDFDTLVENTILNYEESPLEYYTESGYANSKK